MNGERIRIGAWLLGMGLVAGLTVVGCFSVFLYYELIGTGYLPRGMITTLLLLLALNGVLRFAKRRWCLRQRELILIFCLLLAMAAIPGQQFSQHVYLNIAGLVYYADGTVAPENLYLRYIPAWLVPAKDRAAEPVRRFFEGLREGDPIPYRAWLVPLLVWTPYWLALYGMLLCWGALWARHWEDREKLLYPLMQIPRELVQSEPFSFSPLLRHKGMWAAFLACVVLYLLRGLNSYFPAVPALNLQRSTGQIFPSGPLGTALNNRALHLYPEMVGIAYLLASEVGFSLWFFYLLRLFEVYLRAIYSLTPTDSAFFQFQTVGGYAVLAGALFWTARRHLGNIIKEALGWARPDPQEMPPLPYRWAFWGFWLCWGFIVFWCTRVGMETLWAVLLFGALPLAYLVVARVICEAGMFIYTTPFRLYDVLFETAGTEILGVKNVTLATMVGWSEMRSTATAELPYLMQAYRLAAEGGRERWRITLGMGLAILVTIFVSHVVSLYVIYRAGLGKLSWWASGAARNTTRNLVGYLTNPTEMDLEEWFALLLGGGLTALLVRMRLRYVWWPFHPLGFVAWYGWPIDRYVVSIFLGWLAKVITLRIGGLKLFRDLRPIAFGLVLGICFILTFWLVFHLFVPGPPVIFE